MFKSEESRECLKKMIGWKDHYDLTEIPALNPDLKVSETGEFYQEKHPALRLDLIKSTLPSNRDLEEYLEEVEDSAITELLREIVTMKQMDKVGKEIVANDIIVNSEGFRDKKIINEGRFVGVRFRLEHEIGIKATINRLALQLTNAQNPLKIYVYHSHREEPLKEIDFVSTKLNSFNWMEVALDLMADDKELSGGSFFIGYYQDDLIGQAIQYDKLNWKTGFCGTCDGGSALRRYTSVSRHCNMRSFYVPANSLDSNRKMFDPDSIIESDTTNWGFNFNVSIKCDLTNFWCDNRLSLVNALGLRVTYKILKDISYSTQINHIEEQLKMMIIRDLEGDKETNYINIADQYQKALKAVKFDHSAINSVCLPCSVNSGVRYGVV